MTTGAMTGQLRNGRYWHSLRHGRDHGTVRSASRSESLELPALSYQMVPHLRASAEPARRPLGLNLRNSISHSLSGRVG